MAIFCSAMLHPDTRDWQGPGCGRRNVQAQGPRADDAKYRSYARRGARWLYRKSRIPQ